MPPSENENAVSPWARVLACWWREIAYVVGFYGVYTLVRNMFGSASVGTEQFEATDAADVNQEKIVKAKR